MGVGLGVGVGLGLGLGLGVWLGVGVGVELDPNLCAAELGEHGWPLRHGECARELLLGL